MVVVVLLLWWEVVVVYLMLRHVVEVTERRSSARRGRRLLADITTTGPGRRRQLGRPPAHVRGGGVSHLLGCRSSSGLLLLDVLSRSFTSLLALARILAL